MGLKFGIFDHLERRRDASLDQRLRSFPPGGGRVG